MKKRTQEQISNILEAAKKDGVAAAAKTFGVSPSQVYNWRASRNQLTRVEPTKQAATKTKVIRRTDSDRAKLRQDIDTWTNVAQLSLRNLSDAVRAYGQR